MECNIPLMVSDIRALKLATDRLDNKDRERHANPFAFVKASRFRFAEFRVKFVVIEPLSDRWNE